MVTKPVKKTEKAVKSAPAVKAHHEGRYKQGVGGRKTASAQVRIYPKSTGILINDKDYTAYFPSLKHQMIVTAPLVATEMKNAVGVTVKVNGGGTNAQAEAVRHGLARALVAHDPEFKKKLRREGFMTRDSRHVERKKYGLKKARRAPQWAKR